MKKPVVASIFSAALFVVLSAGAGWVNLDDGHRIGGRKCSADYLVGKVVFVCGWKPGEEGLGAKLARMEELWSSFKTKNFVLIGSFRGGDGCRAEAKEKIDELKLTFPVYADVDFVQNASSRMDAEMYVVDALGRLSYAGKSDRRASEVFIEKISEYDSPIDPVALKSIYAFEVRELPARAMIRYAMFKKDRKLSKDKELAQELEAKARELKGIEGIKDLTSLVAAARKYKDCAPKDKMERNRLPGRIESAIKKFERLKDSENKIVAREAKGALADLMWALAGAKGK